MAQDKAHWKRQDIKPLMNQVGTYPSIGQKQKEEEEM